MNNISKPVQQFMARRQEIRRGSQSNASIITTQEQSPHPPRRVSNMSDLAGTLDDRMDSDDMSISSSWLPKEVSFARYSNLHVYEVDGAEKFKSYSSTERKAFQVEAHREAAHILSLIEGLKDAGSSYEGTAAAIRHLLDSGKITPEELVGIESLITRKSGMKVLKERRIHSALVLEKQRELKENNYTHAEQKLAAAAIARSLKSARMARSRAALAA